MNTTVQVLRAILENEESGQVTFSIRLANRSQASGCPTMNIQLKSRRDDAGYIVVESPPSDVNDGIVLYYLNKIFD